jgi:hypothetical protein
LTTRDAVAGGVTGAGDEGTRVAGAAAAAGVGVGTTGIGGGGGVTSVTTGAWARAWPSALMAPGLV